MKKERKYRLYKVQKEKTNIQGVWYDTDNNKLYYDNIKIIEYAQGNILNLQQGIRNLFSLGEVCVAYTDLQERMILEYKDKKDILYHRILIQEKNKPSKEYIKLLIAKFGGVTIYHNKNKSYTLEVYK